MPFDTLRFLVLYFSSVSTAYTEALNNFHLHAHLDINLVFRPIRGKEQFQHTEAYSATKKKNDYFMRIYS